jgi:hypothetical protein
MDRVDLWTVWSHEPNWTVDRAGPWTEPEQPPPHAPVPSKPFYLNKRCYALPKIPPTVKNKNKTFFYLCRKIHKNKNNSKIISKNLKFFFQKISINTTPFTPQNTSKSHSHSLLKLSHSQIFI